MARRTNGPVASSLLFVKRDETCTVGKPGTFSTEPREIDEVVRRVWQPIYDGNSRQPEQIVDVFFTKYARHIYTSMPVEVEEMIWDLVYQAFTRGKTSAAGLDSWEPEELAFMSMQVCD